MSEIEEGCLVRRITGKGSSGKVVDVGKNSVIVDWGIADGVNHIKRVALIELELSMTKADYAELCARQREKLI